MPHKMLFCALVLLLSGCAVYGGGYDRAYHNGHSYRYNDGYRREYYPPPRYRYEDRRQRYYPTQPRYVPAPPPRHYYGHDQRQREGYKRHDRPRYEDRREHRRQGYRSGQTLRGWDTGRSTEHRFSNGRNHR